MFTLICAVIYGAALWLCGIVAVASFVFDRLSLGTRLLYRKGLGQYCEWLGCFAWKNRVMLFL